MKILSTRPCLRLRTNLEPRIAFWGPDLGHILVPVSGSIFGHRFGPLQLQTKSRAPKPRPKWNPKQGPKYDPNQAPKTNPGPQICTERKQGRVEMSFIQRSVCLAILFNCATNQQLQPKRRETWAGKIAQTKSMNTFADQTYLEGTPNGHHILPPFQPPKIGPLNCHIRQHQHSGNLHTKSEREREKKKDVCNIYVCI